MGINSNSAVLAALKDGRARSLPDAFKHARPVVAEVLGAIGEDGQARFHRRECVWTDQRLHLVSQLFASCAERATAFLEPVVLQFRGTLHLLGGQGFQDVREQR